MLRNSFGMLFLSAAGIIAAAPLNRAADLSAESRPCVACHESKTPGIVAQWRASKHAVQGVGCFECHNADAKDPGAFPH